MPVIVAIVVVLAVVAMVMLAVFAPRLFDEPDVPPADTIPISAVLDRIAAEGSLQYDSWQLEPSHRRPTTPYDLERAHAAMQHHRECMADTCPAKRAAMDTLADSRKVQFDERAVR